MISEFVDPVFALDDEVVKPSGLEYVFGVSRRKGTPMLRVEMAKAAFVYWKHDGVRRQQRKTWLQSMLKDTTLRSEALENMSDTDDEETSFLYELPYKRRKLTSSHDVAGCTR